MDSLLTSLYLLQSGLMYCRLLLWHVKLPWWVNATVVIMFYLLPWSTRWNNFLRCYIEKQSFQSTICHSISGEGLAVDDNVRKQSISVRIKLYTAVRLSLLKSTVSATLKYACISETQDMEERNLHVRWQSCWFTDVRTWCGADMSALVMAVEKLPWIIIVLEIDVQFWMHWAEGYSKRLGRRKRRWLWRASLSWMHESNSYYSRELKYRKTCWSTYYSLMLITAGIAADRDMPTFSALFNLSNCP